MTANTFGRCRGKYEIFERLFDNIEEKTFEKMKMNRNEHCFKCGSKRAKCNLETKCFQSSKFINISKIVAGKHKTEKP